MAPNQDKQIIKDNRHGTYQRFNSKPEVSQSSKVVDENPKKKKNVCHFKKNSINNKGFSNAVLNPATGQCILFNDTVKNASKLNHQNKYASSTPKPQNEVKNNLDQVQTKPSLNENQRVALSNLPGSATHQSKVMPSEQAQMVPMNPFSVPPPNYVINHSQKPIGRKITKRPEPFFTPSPNLRILHATNSKWKVFATEFTSGNARPVYNDTSKKVVKRVRFTAGRKVQYIPKSKEFNEEMRFLPISAKIPERYPYDVIRASGHLRKINGEFFMKKGSVFY
jgi:hypothetical protein